MSEDVALPAGVLHLRCANPGPMTLTGTNTYVVAQKAIEDSQQADVAVIDPGPAFSVEVQEHYDRICRATLSATTTGHVALLLTHHHEDHSGGVEYLREALHELGLTVTVYGTGRSRFPAAVGELEVLRTPGHTKDSVCFSLQRDGVEVLFTGDTVLGGSSSFVAYPDGDLTAYLQSLDLLAQCLDGDRTTVLAPGHGVISHDAANVVEIYRKHRQERLRQVADVLERCGPDAGVGEVIAEVYADISDELRPAVEAIVRAQVEHLKR